MFRSPGCVMTTRTALMNRMKRRAVSKHCECTVWVEGLFGIRHGMQCGHQVHVAYDLLCLTL